MSGYSIDFRVFLKDWSLGRSISFKVTIGSPWPYTDDYRPFVSTIKNKLDWMRINHENGRLIDRIEFVSQAEDNN